MHLDVAFAIAHHELKRAVVVLLRLRETHNEYLRECHRLNVIR